MIRYIKSIIINVLLLLNNFNYLHQLFIIRPVQSIELSFDQQQQQQQQYLNQFQPLQQPVDPPSPSLSTIFDYKNDLLDHLYGGILNTQLPVKPTDTQLSKSADLIFKFLDNTNNNQIINENDSPIVQRIIATDEILPSKSIDGHSSLSDGSSSSSSLSSYSTVAPDKLEIPITNNIDQPVEQPHTDYEQLSVNVNGFNHPVKMIFHSHSRPMMVKHIQDDTPPPTQPPSSLPLLASELSRSSLAPPVSSLPQNELNEQKVTDSNDNDAQQLCNVERHNILEQIVEEIYKIIQPFRRDTAESDPYIEKFDSPANYVSDSSMIAMSKDDDIPNYSD